PDVFGQVVVQPAAEFHGLDDRGEVVVGEDHHRGFLGDLGAGDAHGDADVGPLEGRGVIDAITGHRDDLALLLQGVHQADLVLGGDPRDHTDVVDRGRQLALGYLRELGAGDNPAVDAKLASDRRRGGGDVTGDHQAPGDC